MKKTMISFVIDGDVLSQLDDAAEANDKSRSQILRDAVAKYVEEETETSLKLVTEEVTQ